MLKPYVDRNGSGVNLATNSVSAVNVVGLPTGYALEVDGLIDKDVLTSCGSHSAILSTSSLALNGGGRIFHSPSSPLFSLLALLSRLFY